MKRTHTCGELTIKNINNKVTLQGWIKKIRKMGAMTFIDLRDMYGITQLIINDSTSIANLDLKNEFVIEVKGTVIERKSKNQDMITGEIEIEVENITVINQAELTPFQIENDIEVLEDTRLKYRYLDIRRLKMKDNLVLRSKVYSAIRSFMNDNAFLEIETPFFGKSTPEGARDFLVPSRINKNKFYALPQSPQLYKQLFMVAGIDRYYQIARCFRDEDLRIDRQLEFTQLDLEMNFSTGDDVMIMVEKLIKYVLKETKQIDIIEPLLKLPYSDAIKYYGSDKPDIRYDLKIHDLNHIFKDTQVKFLQKENSSIRGIMIDEVLMKKQLEELNETANQNQFQTLAFAKFENNTWSGSIASSLSENEKQAILKEFDIADKGTLLIQTGEYNQISQMMGAVRVNLSKMFNLANKDEYKLLWVTDFPLFEYNDEEKRYVAAHHPFTMPAVESLDNFDKDKANAKAFAYDLVMNGFELGGGSQRITNIDIQQRMFDAVGLSKETIDANFGWFTNAYKYGAPYHAGFAWGMDRLIMLLTQSESIRDVIAFPKNSSGVDPMTNAPDFVANHQLEELNIKIK